MTDTPFKVGETYRTRDGREARCIAHMPEGSPVFAIKHGGDWMLALREKDGTDCECSRDDILPPRRGVWVAVDVETGEPHPGSGASSVEPTPKTRWRVPGHREQHDVWLEWRFFIEAEDQP